MSESFCSISPVWRHVCPKIYDLNVNVSLTKKYTQIHIPRELLIQGAGPANVFIQGTFHSQNGFRCSPEITQNPSKGLLEVFGNGWIYTPYTLGPLLGGTDVIKYHLVLNHEPSLEAFINIKFTA